MPLPSKEMEEWIGREPRTELVHVRYPSDGRGMMIVLRGLEIPPTLAAIQQLVDELNQIGMWLIDRPRP